MIVKKVAFALLFASGLVNLSAQDDAKMMAPTGYRSFSPQDQWEIGVGAGAAFINGDLDPKLGLGAGLHLRKSLDHIFSVRGNVNFAQTSAEGTSTANDKRTADLTWMSGSVQLVAALNNFRFNKPYRKILLNAYGGIGINNFTTKYKNIPRGVSFASGEETGTNAHMEIGGEVSFRINSKFNISLANTLFSSFGSGADLLDGDDNTNSKGTTYRDNLFYPHVTLNFNIGKKSKDGGLKSEPIYWVNPMHMFQDAITALEARPIFDPTDTDGDGVIDAVDQEKESASGARVDTRGVTLDSDSDGLADYKDKEPYSPPGYKVDGMGVAQVPKAPNLSESDVNRLIDAKLANFKLPSQKGLVDWFLPMIHFDLDRYSIKKAEYEKIYQVATVLKQNPELRVVVIGHTDKSAGVNYNNVLSYNRAKAAIDFLVAQHGISRDRLVLNWGGEDKSLVDTKTATYINRRVEFKVATNETEMPRPAGPNAGSGSFKGNKDAGY